MKRTLLRALVPLLILALPLTAHGMEEAAAPHAPLPAVENQGGAQCGATQGKFCSLFQGSDADTANRQTADPPAIAPACAPLTEPDGKPACCLEAFPKDADLPALLPMTAQAWISDFLEAAKITGLWFREDFRYVPVLTTGQHIYDLTVEESPYYYIGLGVFGHDGVSIETCSMRLVTSFRHSEALVQVTGVLRDAAITMIMASDPSAGKDTAAAVFNALSPDLAAALIRMEDVEAECVRQGVRYSLWAGFKADAFFGGAPDPCDGYIVDFLVEAAMPGEEDTPMAGKVVYPLPNVTRSWQERFLRAAGNMGLTFFGGFVYREDITEPFGLDVYTGLAVSECVALRLELDEALAPLWLDVILETGDNPARNCDACCEQFTLAVLASLKVIDPEMTDDECGGLVKRLGLDVSDRLAFGVEGNTKFEIHGVSYELTVDPDTMGVSFRATPAMAK